MAAEPQGGLTGPQPTDNEIDTNWDECVETFDAMDLREDLLRGIYAYGFEKPSAIQQVCMMDMFARHVCLMKMGT